MLQKQPLNINFSQGVDTKTDPFQLAPGKFLKLENSIFDKAGRLTKRNGYGALTPIPTTTDLPTYITTFAGNLTAVGNRLDAYSAGSEEWIDKGRLRPLNLSTLSLVKTNTSQTQADSATASNGLMCVAYTDQDPSDLTKKIYKYAIIDSVTGQYIVNPVQLTNADATYGTPRVFLLNNYFVIIYTTKPASYHLVYQAISVTDLNNVIPETDISTSYAPATTLSFDGVVAGNKLFIAYYTTSGGNAIKITYIGSNLLPASVTTVNGYTATMFSLVADINVNTQLPTVYISFYNGTNGYIVAVDENALLIPAFSTPIQWTNNTKIKNITSTINTNYGIVIYYEVENAYSFDSNFYTNYVSANVVSFLGAVSAAQVVCRSVGLASKAVTVNNADYFLALYQSTYEPTYFLINAEWDSPTTAKSQVAAILSSSNGAASYYTHGLPNVTLSGVTGSVCYLRRDLIQSINQTATSFTAGIYSQTGINLAKFTLANNAILSAEIGSNLNLTGGFLTAYDGVAPTEQGFFLYPDMDVAATLALPNQSAAITVSNNGGPGVPAKSDPSYFEDTVYYYQVTYEWTDNQGNLFRSAPSLPVFVNTDALTPPSGFNNNNRITINVPTLRLTYKTASPVRIVVYRWSTTQQTYYQITSVSQPVLNDPSIDSVQVIDTFTDAQIVGNNILYTTGGVVENIVAPATANMCLFNNRLFLVDAENRNLLWFSKQVIQNTPVEMSDLLTLYVAPTTASQGSTGPITALAPMDDKLVIFKQNALGYINGSGPDNTGANNQYSDFTLINSVVGCINQRSIVFTPLGLMFQSAKGIWLLGRDLSTAYIGAPVESLTTGATVQSAVNVPGTTQVRFTLDSGITLMYDYFFQQWGTFTNVPAISSTIYDNLHTYINSYGQVFQETPEVYLDNTSPVLMNFTTGWINLAGLQGFERFYTMFLLGQYFTPFKLNVQLGYDYNPSPSQSIIVTPDNYSANYGNDPLWGNNALWGGASKVFEARLFPQRQKCESFQISVQELYDPSYGQAAGQGLTLSGMNLVVGMKKGYRTSPASRNFG